MLNKELFKKRMFELCDWTETSFEGLCRKHDVNAQLLRNIFKRGSRLLDFLCDICEENEIELNWLLGIDKE